MYFLFVFDNEGVFLTHPRRAKLKRLTTNDRERMLKSRALPDDFDTTQVLRTPFEHKSASETPVRLFPPSCHDTNCTI